MSNSGNYFNNSGNISNSNINLTQENISNKHIEYSPNKGTQVEILKEDHEHELKKFYINLFLDSSIAVVEAISLVSDFSLLKLVLLIIALFYMIFILFYFDESLWLKRNSKILESTLLYKDGYFYFKNTKNTYEKAEFQAKCIYPKCGGIINLVEAPVREKENGHNLVGICSNSGRQHSYSFDGNGIGFPKEFDWRPIENTENQTQK